MPSDKKTSLLFVFLMIENNIRQFQFTRLIFEATCSPFCAIYVLHKCAEDNKIQFSAALNAIKHHFYIDDYIQSLPKIAEAKNSISQTKTAGNKNEKRQLQDGKICLAEISDDEKDETKEIMRVLGQKLNLTIDNFCRVSPTTISVQQCTVHKKEITQFGILNF